MTHLTVRNIDPDLAAALEEEKRRRGTSTNQLVLDLLRSALAVGPAPWTNGLERHLRRWSHEELEEFEAAIAPLEQVDEDVRR